MKKIIFLLLLPIIVSYSTPNFSGTIIDSNTNETLAGVTISTDHSKTYSDFDGNFSINGYPTFQLISYQLDSISNDIVYMSN